MIKDTDVPVHTLSPSSLRNMDVGIASKSTSLTTLINKKLSCRREAAQCFVSLSMLLSHPRSLEMAPFDKSYTSSLRGSVY